MTAYTRIDAIRPTTIDEDCPPKCAICMEPLEITSQQAASADAETAATIKECGHVFGQNCLLEWTQEHNTCPVCRVEFFSMSRIMTALARGAGPQHFVMGVYGLGNSSVDVTIDGGQQSRVSLDVSVRSIGSDTSGQNHTMAEDRGGDGRVRYYVA
jgi:hypothetical protein